MKIVTAEQMRELDTLSIERDGIPSLRLMENAGRQVFHFLIKKFGKKKGLHVVLFCGPGNNGGDGLVLARLLLKKKVSVQVLLLTDPKDIKGDAKTQYNKIKKFSSIINSVSSLTDLKKFAKVRKSTVFVDALFGTGLSRPVTGIFKQVILWINKQRVPVISVDSPSGLDANSGKTLGLAISADATVTLGLPKKGFFLHQGPVLTGQVTIVDIGLSKKALAEIYTPIHLITPADILTCTKTRERESHKGSYGHVYVVASSYGKLGAGIMATLSSLRGGAGLATLVLPDSAYAKINMQAPEIMFAPVNDCGRGYFVKKNGGEVLRLAKGASVMALGPGLGTKPQTILFVHELVKKWRGVLIVDADGLNALAKKPGLLLARCGPTLLTPHPAEMGRLVGKSTAYVQAHRMEVAAKFAKKYGVVVLLKGYHSVVAMPDGQIWINPTGNPAMASAGQGDVLTGLYAALIAQFSFCREALLFGCYLHGLVGDLLFQKGYRVTMATDIMMNLGLGYRFIKNYYPKNGS